MNDHISPTYDAIHTKKCQWGNSMFLFTTTLGIRFHHHHHHHHAILGSISTRVGWDTSQRPLRASIRLRMRRPRQKLIISWCLGLLYKNACFSPSFAKLLLILWPVNLGKGAGARLHLRKEQGEISEISSCQPYWAARWMKLPEGFFLFHRHLRLAGKFLGHFFCVAQS